MVPRTEVTLGSSGRLDTIYNRFIVEWEKPRSLKPINTATKNRETIAQVQRYGDTMFFRTREKPGRIVGCCTDGCYFIFVTKPERHWIATDPVPVNEESCRRFLDYFTSLQSGVALLPDYLSEDFSSDNQRTQRAVKALYESLTAHANAPALAAVFDQWALFYGASTDYEQWRVKLANESHLREMVKKFGIAPAMLDLNRFFFATHTFFAILTKLLAYIVVGRYTNLPTPPLADWKNLSNEKLAKQFIDLEKGGPFHAAGIRNFLEGDFFAWYTKYFTPELADRLRAVVDRLADYDPATLDLAPAPTQDLLKKLYHRLVPKHVRKALGEYYTPDWLAQRVLHMLDGGRFRGDPDTRLLDPACGSGTFLVMAINSIRSNTVAQSLPPGELLRKICHNVVGIDLNPLAVTAARTNFLLALGPLLAHRGKESLEIPVYLADSILTPSRAASGLFDHELVKVTLSIGQVELPRQICSQRGIAALTDLLDEHLGDHPTSPDKFLPIAKRTLTDRNLDWERDGPVLDNLYRRLFQLHKEGRNGMWARIIKNAFAPVFLAPFDLIAGNPPWVGWENLPEAYRNETRQLWIDHGLFVHKGMDTILGKGKKDLSMLMTYVAADNYLKDGGKLGFLITQAVFKMAGAAQGFRQFVTRRKAHLNCYYVDDLSSMQVFEGATNKTALFVLRKGEKQKYPVSYSFWVKKQAGRAGSFDYDTTLEEVTSKLTFRSWAGEPVDDKDRSSAWLTGNRFALRAVKSVLGKSDYKAHEGVNSGGANAIYWFELLRSRGQTSVARNLVDNAKRKVESVQVELESDALLPLLRLQDVEPFRAKAGAHFLFLQDVRSRRGLDESTVKERWPKAYEWVLRHRKLLVERAAYKRYFDPKVAPFYTIFNTGAYTIAPCKVVWRAIDTRVRAAVSMKEHGKIVLPQHIVSFIDVPSRTEAHFIAGVMNSTPFRFAVNCFSQPGSKSFGTPSILEKARVPKFDPDSKVHKAIVAEAERLSDGATDAADEYHPKLDRLCAPLWGIDDKGLKSLEEAYLELYGTKEKGEASEDEDVADE